jgi:hypothetical protein
MNWVAIGAIGEMVGAFAVVISLIYLALQIRAQNKESRIAAMHEIAVAYRESNIPFADPNLANILTRAHKDTDTLTDAEVVQLIVGVQGVFRVWEEAYYQHIAGRLDANLWEAMLREYSSYLSAPGFFFVWQLRKNYHNDEFRNFVEALPRSEYEIRLPEKS